MREAGKVGNKKYGEKLSTKQATVILADILKKKGETMTEAEVDAFAAKETGRSVRTIQRLKAKAKAINAAKYIKAEQRAAAAAERAKVNEMAKELTVAGIPVLSEGLCEETIRVMKSFVSEISKTVTLTALDILSLRMLATAYDKYQKALETLEKDGDLSIGYTGERVKHPAHGIVQLYQRQAFQIMAEYGATLRSRKKIADFGEQGEVEQSAFEKLLGKNYDAADGE
ncbi:MAG: P27 family phage terminase small subunit [Tannerellaceae bacterium]|jgi:P27 family predicted phage terminase small subunit|nr:P27 family phage terminase small subunit [Tannerellaceae bacterium]